MPPQVGLGLAKQSALFQLSILQLRVHIRVYIPKLRVYIRVHIPKLRVYMPETPPDRCSKFTNRLIHLYSEISNVLPSPSIVECS